jgi:hypothetical protein
MEVRIVININRRKIKVVDVNYVLNRLDYNNDYIASCVARGYGRVRSNCVKDCIYDNIVNNKELSVIVNNKELKGINAIDIKEL